MLNGQLQDTYVTILQEKLRPVMGCTGPIAIGYAGVPARNGMHETDNEIIHLMMEKN